MHKKKIKSMVYYCPKCNMGMLDEKDTKKHIKNIVKMGINELRIGNWVFADTELPFLEQHQLLYSDMIDLLKGKLRDKITPISLTEEWFKKFLDKYDFIPIQDSDYPEGDLSIVWKDDHARLENCADGYLFGKPITTVHHLQNIYYELKHEELTITN